MSKIVIAFKSGEQVVWDGGEGREWDDYSYDGSAFIVKYHGAWVGIYNFDVVAAIYAH